MKVNVKLKNWKKLKKICNQIYGFPTEMLLSISDVSLIKSGELFQRQVGQDKEIIRYFLMLLPNWLVISSVVDKKEKEVDHTKYKYKLCDSIPLKEMQFHLDHLKQLHAIKNDSNSADSILYSEIHYKFQHESQHEIQLWYITLQDTLKACTKSDELLKESDKFDKRKKNSSKIY